MTEGNFLQRFLKKEELFLEHSLPYLFHTGQCRMPLWLYIAFRFLLAVITLHSFVLAVIYGGGNKFLVYFTNWTYFVQTVTMVYKLAVVIYHAGLHRCRLEEADYSPAEYSTLPIHLKIKWILHNITTAIPFIVTIVYWTMLYNSARPNPGIESYINMELHGINSVVAIVDFFVCAIPFRLYHFLHAVAYGLVYIIFSIIYYFCGGTGIKNSKTIYFFLDWGEKPGVAIMYVFGILIVIAVFHFLFAYLKHLQSTGPCGGFCSNANQSVLNVATTTNNKNSSKLVEQNPYNNGHQYNRSYVSEDTQVNTV